MRASGHLRFDIPAYIERLEFEIAMIQKMKFSGYFLIVWDFIRYAKSKGIPVGPGRGSATGSLVGYAMSITDIDPQRTADELTAQVGKAVDGKGLIP